MPRTQGVYTPPAGTLAETQTTISSAKFNAFVQDIVSDLNTVRPVSVAGVGAEIFKQTKALLEADLDHNEDVSALVYGDFARANNGIYLKVGVSGSGSWSQITNYLPGWQDATAEAMDVGGTANSISATIADYPGPEEAKRLILVPQLANTSGTVELALNGEPSKALKSASGNDLAIGALQPGIATELYKSGNEWRLLYGSIGATLDYQGLWNDTTTYSDAQFVAKANKLYYLQAGTSTNEDPENGAPWVEVFDLSTVVADSTPDGSELPVGSCIEWPGLKAPNGFWLKINTPGQVYTRATYPQLFDVLSPEYDSVVITSGSAVVTGIGSTELAELGDGVGVAVEGDGIPTGTTILSIDGPFQITLSQSATNNGTALRVFPHGNGDGATTAGLPDRAGNYGLVTDITGTRNPDAAQLGDRLDDALQGHWHEYGYNQGARGTQTDSGKVDVISNGSDAIFVSDRVQDAISDGVHGTPRTADRTRPITGVVSLIIKVADGIDDPATLTAISALQELAAATANIAALEADLEAVKPGEIQTVSNVAGIDINFSEFIDAQGNAVVDVTLLNSLPTTDNNSLFTRFSDDVGSSFNASGIYERAMTYVVSGGTTYEYSSNDTNARISMANGGGADEGCRGSFRIIRTTTKTTVEHHAHSFDSAANPTFTTGSVTTRGVAANVIRFYYTSSNVASAQFIIQNAMRAA